jgi:hypothetical protein
MIGRLGTVVYVPDVPPNTSGTVTDFFSIKLEDFKRLVRRDGFGTIFLNDCRDKPFVTMHECRTHTVTSEIGFRPGTAQNFVSTRCQDFSRQPYDA